MLKKQKAKVESSAKDKAMDKKMGVKEGSARDEMMDTRQSKKKSILGKY